MVEGLVWEELLNEEKPSSPPSGSPQQLGGVLEFPYDEEDCLSNRPLLPRNDVSGKGG